MFNKEDINKIEKYFRAVNYIAAIQIYLRSNFLLERTLDFDDIKPRLLGHWGTCPGINFVYSHLQYFIKQNKVNMIFVNGPGHGAPAIQANLFVEGSLEKFYPRATRNIDGLSYVAKNFSWPYGFPSHSFPGTPGCILEGGELGYSLSVAYGAVLDNPDLIVACLIGDGEAETGPLAASWHLNKFLDPRYNGVVLPILHLNGYKISGPTIYGRMSYTELINLFIGFGYRPYIVDLVPGENIHVKMQEILNDSYIKIKEIQNKFRYGSFKDNVPNWPLIILKTPKGWTGIKELKNKKLEGNYLSHQVIAKNARTDIEELQSLESWLTSYKFNELFDPQKGFIQDILDIIPEDGLKMSLSKYVNFDNPVNLKVTDSSLFSEYGEKPGQAFSSSMRRIGELLNSVIKENSDKRCFRVFSPDETFSNKLDKIFDSTNRVFIWPKDKYDAYFDNDGMVIEMLSEHVLFGLLEGYILTGRAGIFVSYEAFVQIISSMADQYLKFVKISRQIPWRPKYNSLNIILTSSGWRQDHNGFSHQNPGFLSSIIEKEDPFVKVFFPLDGNTALATLEYCLKNTNNGINIIIVGKTLEPVWLDIYQAKYIVDKGIQVLDFLSDDNPDIIFCGIGDYVTKELIAARKILKQEINHIKIKFIYVIELSSLRDPKYDILFEGDLPVIFNFHGYPDTLKKILFNKKKTERFFISGYVENGSTTTPYDMQIRNGTSRWHIVLKTISILYELNKIDEDVFKTIKNKYEAKFIKHIRYIQKFGVDMPEVENFDFSI